MNKIFLLIALSFSIGAFAKNSKGKPFVCPVNLSNGDSKQVPVQEFKLSKKEKILICVPEEMTEDGQLKGKFLTQYDAYLFQGKKAGKRVLSGSLTTPVKFEFKKGQLSEIIHLNMRGIFHPLYKEQIVCANGKCKRKEKVCIFNQYHMSPPSPKDLEREKVIFAKGSAQVQEMTDTDLAQMSNMALTGRKLAFEFFTQMDPLPILLGDNASFYQHMKSLLNQMKSEGCLKIQEK